MTDTSSLRSTRAAADPNPRLIAGFETIGGGIGRLPLDTLVIMAPVRPLDPRRPAYTLVQEDGCASRSIRSYIASCFANAYGARVPRFMPRLYGLCDARGRLCGAVGLRRGDEALYLEQYLDAAIERVIERHAGSPCDRRHVSEVGHLCGAFPGVVRVLIDLVTKRLADEGASWVTFTGTPRLHNAFARLGLTPIDVGPARADAVSAADRAAWGTYYDEAPRVYIGSVPLGDRILHAPPDGLRG